VVYFSVFQYLWQVSYEWDVESEPADNVMHPLLSTLHMELLQSCRVGTVRAVLRASWNLAIESWRFVNDGHLLMFNLLKPSGFFMYHQV